MKIQGQLRQLRQLSKKLLNLYKKLLSDRRFNYWHIAILVLTPNAKPSLRLSPYHW
ncbi:hypothetical protein [Nostoc sp. PCC 9305]|uniref:hypothetical protein n=1 Tax=Nostoc sp. PCC 9305 TaxID=296636 RepID=UPI0039C5C46C